MAFIQKKANSNYSDLISSIRVCLALLHIMFSKKFSNVHNMKLTMRIVEKLVNNVMSNNNNKNCQKVPENPETLNVYDRRMYYPVLV